MPPADWSERIVTIHCVLITRARWSIQNNPAIFK